MFLARLHRPVLRFFGRATLSGGLAMLAGGFVLAHGPIHDRIRGLDEALKKEPGRADLLVQRADCHRIDGAWASALADLDAAERASGVGGMFLWVRAQVHAGRQDDRAARIDLDRWLDANPDHVGALTLRAEIHSRAGDWGAAVRDYDRAIAAVSPPDPDLVVARARAMRASGPDGAAAALVGVEAEIGRLGPLVVLQQEALALEEALGRTDAALARIDSMIRRMHRPESWLVRKAELLERVGRPEDAQSAWQSAYEACLRLPAHLRRGRAQQTLESRIISRLDPSRVSAAQRSVGMASDGDAASGKPAQSVSTVPRRQPAP